MSFRILRHMCTLHIKETEISQKRSKGIKNWKITYSVILSVLSNKTNLIFFLWFLQRSRRLEIRDWYKILFPSVITESGLEGTVTLFIFHRRLNSGSAHGDEDENGDDSGKRSNSPPFSPVFEGRSRPAISHMVKRREGVPMALHDTSTDRSWIKYHYVDDERRKRGDAILLTSYHDLDIWSLKCIWNEN